MKLGEVINVKVTGKITTIIDSSCEIVRRMKHTNKPLTHNGEIWNLKNNISNEYR
jgi:hypothetical protein